MQKKTSFLYHRTQLCRLKSPVEKRFRLPKVIQHETERSNEMLPHPAPAATGRYSRVSSHASRTCSLIRSPVDDGSEGQR